MEQNILDEKIKNIAKNVREAHELLKEAVSLSEDIDFNELKNTLDIKKHEETVHYIAQDLSFMQVGSISALNLLYNREYGEISAKVYLENNNLSCLFDELPDEFKNETDKYMWDDLKKEFRKIAYRPYCNQDIIDKVYEFYKIKTNEELTLESEGFCRDYVKKKGDTGILSGKWWTEVGICKILDNYRELEIKYGDRDPEEEV